VKPRPRIRKTLKWGDVLLTLILAAFWVASTRYYYTFRPSASFEAQATLGLIAFVYYPNATPDWIVGWPLFDSYPSKVPTAWAPRFEYHPGRACMVALPAWMLLALVAPLPAFVWRRDALARRRSEKDLCPHCQYDRTGLAPSAVCPECGTHAEPPR